ncbi:MULTISPECIES: hypothetical protein [unclassified Citrobacter]|uniref:hypothetical protein n=1 Tax=unclassified Citrobacter TaxID=2644389 RepID=UPI001B3598A0|nr:MULTISPECIES: hypothetical protein [unclassified Citrobacter]MBP8540635.1 hypothetical protein [Citrobacter sp. On2M]MBW5275474.1 hypothetical protein [Citrobacter sp. On28M]
MGFPFSLFAGDPTTWVWNLIICAIAAFSRKRDASLRTGAQILQKMKAYTEDSEALKR